MVCHRSENVLGIELRRFIAESLFRRALRRAALFAAAHARPGHWEYGHESVARIAWLQMQPGTRSKVAALLRQEGLLETPDCPVATLEQASIWADCIKPLGDRSPMPTVGTIRTSIVASRSI